MTYELFKTKLYEELTGYFPPDTSITIQKISKNNQVELDGLTILESGLNIAPTIYIEEYYERMQHNVSFSEIFQQILDTYQHYRPTSNINTSLFRDFEQIKNMIVYKLVHYERNEKLLQDIPHIPFLDLAIVFYCLISSGENGNATILIHNSHLNMWNITQEELFSLAQKNTPFLLSPSCEKISQLLSELLPSSSLSEELDDMQELDGFSALPMYVLTNHNRFLGAACLLYDELLADLANKYDTDFYIIPSSVHEGATRFAA